MIQVQWPVLDLPAFLTMLINFGLGLLGGLIGGWIAHLLATRRDFQNRKWQEFVHWRNVLDQTDKEVREMAHPALRIQYIYGEAAVDISHFAPVEQRVMERAREARLGCH